MTQALDGLDLMEQFHAKFKAFPAIAAKQQPADFERLLQKSLDEGKVVPGVTLAPSKASGWRAS